MRASITALCQGTAWDRWIPLKNSWRGKSVPTCPGLYRILLIDGERRLPAYIGQSANLKERLAALKHVYGESPPRHSPHFAGPTLWEWQRFTPGAHFEVSVAPFPMVPKPLRLGLEALAIALCQQEYHASPLANFGRTRDEWYTLWHSSASYQTQEMKLIDPLGGDPHKRSWCGMVWTPWISQTHLGDTGSGLYRLRIAGCDPLLYIGQGEIASRLATYRQVSSLEFSWIQGDWSYHRRLELVSRAIGSHLFETMTIPLWQFENHTPGGPADMSNAA